MYRAIGLRSSRVPGRERELTRSRLRAEDDELVPTLNPKRYGIGTLEVPKLAISVHGDVEVTDVREGSRRLVSQAFCSALPVAYGEAPSAMWEAFARLVLEAANEATLLTAVERSYAATSNIVLLTSRRRRCVR